jgi:hypothetical protein
MKNAMLYRAARAESGREARENSFIYLYLAARSNSDGVDDPHAARRCGRVRDRRPTVVQVDEKRARRRRLIAAGRSPQSARREQDIRCFLCRSLARSVRIDAVGASSVDVSTPATNAVFSVIAFFSSCTQCAMRTSRFRRPSLPCVINEPRSREDGGVSAYSRKQSPRRCEELSTWRGATSHLARREALQ